MRLLSTLISVGVAYAFVSRIFRRSSPTSEESTTSLASSTTASPSVRSASEPAPLEPLPLDLDKATLSENARFIEVNRDTAIVLSAPPNTKWAYFWIKVTTSIHDQFPLGFHVKIVASIKVEEMDVPDRSFGSHPRRAKTGSRLQILVDGLSVYDEDAVTTKGKFQEITTHSFNSSEKPRVDMIQEGSHKAVSITFKNVAIAIENSSVQLPDPTATDAGPTATNAGPTATNAGPTATEFADRGTNSSKAWVAGPVVGGCVGMLLLVGVVYQFRRKRAKTTSPSGLHEKAQLHSDCRPRHLPHEDEDPALYEMQGSVPEPIEMTVNEVPATELSSGRTR